MSQTIEKVTAFITRPSQDGHDLLLFQHPHAGIQVPAGTVENGETPQQAVVREAAEETGLTSLSIQRYLDCAEQKLPQEHRIIARSTRVYARPDTTSFDWAYLRTGILVTVNRGAHGFSQVTYQEHDRVPDPQYVTMRITGWVPDDALADTKRRHFFHLTFDGRSPERWTVFSDNHHFTLFWSPLTSLPEIIHPQDEWLAFFYAQFEPE
jgi:8-oxo-dGTP pyrophosphatase MutT (NUDIX family)